MNNLSRGAQGEQAHERGGRHLLDTDRDGVAGPGPAEVGAHLDFGSGGRGGQTPGDPLDRLDTTPGPTPQADQRPDITVLRRESDH